MRISNFICALASALPLCVLCSTTPARAQASSAPSPLQRDARAPAAAQGTLVVVVFVDRQPTVPGVVVRSDDGVEATTSSSGIARLSLRAGRRTLELSIPELLLSEPSRGAPRLMALEAVDVVEGETTQVLVDLTAEGALRRLDVEAPTVDRAEAVPAEAPSGEVEPAAFGAIEGRVVASEKGTPIAGARVFVRGVAVDGVSDAEGRFRLQVPPGQHAVSAIHTQFSTQTQGAIEVQSGETTEIVLELTPASNQLEDLVITAPHIQGGVASLLDERRKSSTVVDALGSEDIAKSPDSSASSATRRIVGASIVGGQYLFVRGLGGRYSNVRLNGVPLPSTDPDLPGFQLDLFPASLLSSLAIAKTFSPDIPGDFAGGSLNVETRGFPDELTVSASIAFTYNTETTFRKLPSYPGGDLDVLGVDDGTRALPSEVPEQRVSTGSGLSLEELVALGRSFPGVWDIDRSLAYPSVSLGLSLGNTLETGFGDIGFLLTLGYRYRFDHYDEEITNMRLEGTGEEQAVVPYETLNREIGAQEAQLGALGALSYRPSSAHRLSAITLLTQNGEDRASLVTGRSENEGTDIRNTQLRFIERRLLFNQLLGEHGTEADSLSVDWQLNTARILRDQPDTREVLYADGPNGYAFRSVTGSGERLYTTLEQTDYGGGVNARVTFAPEQRIKLGYLGRTASRDFSARRFGIQYLGTAADRLLPQEELLAPERSGEIWRINELTRPDDGFASREDLHAGYAMIETAPFDGLMGMAGVRLESFRQKIEVESPYAGANDEEARGTDRTDTDLLPAGSLVLRLSEASNLRAAYGGTVARPLVRELAPFLNQDFVRRRNVQGNPELQRTFIHNFDLRWELFPSPTEVFAVSLFYKAFDAPIESVVLDQRGNITFENIDSATNYGAELEARVGLDLIDDALASFSAFANLALIHSSVTLTPEQQRVATDPERPLAGQSPYVANLALGYEGEDSGFSTYLYYNVFGRRIQEVGRLGLPNVYEEPFHALDFTAFWKTKSKLTLGFSASNLLFRAVRFTQGGFDFSRTQRGASFALSLSWSP